jgi:hypothetical protein
MSNTDEVKKITVELRTDIDAVAEELKARVDTLENDMIAALDEKDIAIADLDAKNINLTARVDGLTNDVAARDAEIVALKAQIPAPTPVPTPTPTPTPDPVPAPTAGYKIVPKNMSLGGNGFYRSNNLGADEVAYIQARLNTPAQAGQLVTFTYQQKTNVIKTGNANIKDRRNYKNSTETYPNDYRGRGLNAGADQITAENGDGAVRYHKSNPTNWTTAYISPKFKPDVVQTIVEEFVYAHDGKSDGRYKLTVDGEVVFESGGWAAKGPRNDFGVQMVFANPGSTGGFPANAYLEAKIVSLTVK